MEYEILYTESLKEIEDAVHVFIEQGWKPQGGVSVHSYTVKGFDATETYHEYHQAMIREGQSK